MKLAPFPEPLVEVKGRFGRRRRERLVFDGPAVRSALTLAFRLAGLRSARDHRKPTA